MRLSVAFLAFAFIASPATAADSIADQAQRAYSVFAGGLSSIGFSTNGYGRSLLNGVTGNWARLSGPDPKTGIETYGVDTEKLCKNGAALALASPDPFSLTVTGTSPGGPIRLTYTQIAGTTFAEHADAASYLQAMGLGPDKQGDAADRQRAFLLSQANRIVQIYAPSPDILVMARESAYPSVLARCPKS